MAVTGQLWEPGLRAFDGQLPGRRSITTSAIDRQDLPPT